MATDFARRRRRMVRRDIARRGVADRRVLAAMGDVPRERFVPGEQADAAYDDRALPIAADQTISQPYVVAWMAEAAEIGDGDRVLEVGTGSGYGAAVLSRLAGEVWTVERHDVLADSAAVLLAELCERGVHVVHGDGTLGWPEAAPFDAIVVTAGGPNVPATLLGQLADDGRLVMPVGSGAEGQHLLRIRRRGDHFDEERLGGVRFVPLIGAEGFSPEDPR